LKKSAISAKLSARFRSASETVGASLFEQAKRSARLSASCFEKCFDGVGLLKD